MKDISRRDILKYGLVGLGAVAFAPLLAIEPSTAYAATIKKLDSSQGMVELDGELALNPDAMTYSWGTKAGRVYTNSSGTFFFAPVTNNKGGFKLNDLLEMKFTGNKVADRDVIITLKINSLEVGTQKSPSAASTLPAYFMFCSVRSASDALLFQQNPSISFPSPYSSYCKVKYRWYLSYTVTIRYADTNEIVELPFHQIITDIDAGGTSSYYREGFTGGSGFNGTYYVYDKHRLNISGTTFQTPDDAGLLDGDDSVIKGGVIALADRGQFSGKYQLGDCGNTLQIYSSIGNLEKPKKSFKAVQ